MESDQPTRIAFFGTPAYAVPTLRALAADPRFEVRAVITQPDRPAGRGHGLSVSAVKEAALEVGLPILQPVTLRDDDVRRELRDLNCDLFVVAAYGLIFGTPILQMPRSGCINLHASILPAYRGAAPIPAAILSGDSETGVTLMVMERGLDTGPIIATAVMPIRSAHTTETLTTDLADLGANLAMMALPRFVAGELEPIPQPPGATKVRQLTKADGQVDWTKPAVVIERHVRAMWPWPRAWSTTGATTLQIHAARGETESNPANYGEVVERHGELAVGTGAGLLIIERGQVAGGKAMTGTELLRGRHIAVGSEFGEAPALDLPLIQPVI
jgi:methionyl-tRNA formyltransferase